MPKTLSVLFDVEKEAILLFIDVELLLVYALLCHDFGRNTDTFWEPEGNQKHQGREETYSGPRGTVVVCDESCESEHGGKNKAQGHGCQDTCEQQILAFWLH